MDRIEALRQKLPVLEQRAEKLRLESNCICGFECGPDGKPQIVCSDDARLLAIGQEMMSIRRQQFVIEEALKRIEEIAGEESTLGSIMANHMGQVEYAARLRSDFMMEFNDISRRRPTGCLTPAEVMATTEYRIACDRFEPEIRDIEAAANESAQLAARVRAILSELKCAGRTTTPFPSPVGSTVHISHPPNILHMFAGMLTARYRRPPIPGGLMSISLLNDLIYNASIKKICAAWF